MTSPWLSDWAQTSTAVVDAVVLHSAAVKAPVVVSLDSHVAEGSADFDEPDCSPHPLDVTTIFAIYQSRYMDEQP